ncbi:single-stranded-DNA-specific exonuclease RecJ [Metaclostridioides mangenotii]|uniref:single-stranded-DNA-specific exonuclease RecJ n=1 Tax=Metaclostridioides mangenotii TaxID=1540 RepID=UPI00047F4DA8|nr:single-stranded-DNA-specific exonuclease RecJ [Clostridioides mangenotii]
MKKWTLKHTGKIKEDELAKKLGISLEISQILKNRGIETEYEAEIFINPSLRYLRDPFLMKDMKKSVDRIEKAIANNEKIWIYGDYDVDGVSSTSVLCLYFKDIGYPVSYYIPNRLEEGYGINEDAIRLIKDRGCDLIISVDCGITSTKEVDVANDLGIDVIITDHHECQDEIPNAFAVVNPKQEDCNYPFDMLCGCGIAFKLIQALTPAEEFETKMYNYLEIVTLATICDIVPLKDENRIIVKNGLKLMRKGKNMGLRELLKVCGVEGDKIGSAHIGFAVGPRINAAGRLGFSYLGVELFTTDSQKEAEEVANLLEDKNEERKAIEADMYREAEEIMSLDKRYEDDKVLVIASEGWQHGVIGIVASKLTEKYYKPTVLLNIEDGEATGSARSIKGFSIFEALIRCSDLMTKFGGHEQAAGLTLPEENIDKLRDEVNKFADYSLTEEDMVENVSVEYELDEKSVSLDLVEELHNLEPFGMSNPTPRFIMRNCELKDIIVMGKTRQHLKLKVEKKSEYNAVGVYEYECVGFNMAYLAESYEVGDRIDVLFQLDQNTYMGNTKIQFLLKDVRMYRPRNINNDKYSISLMNKIIPNDLSELYCLIDEEGPGTDLVNGDVVVDIFEYLQPNTLVITNSANGFNSAVSDISLIDGEFDVNYNIIDNSKDNANIQLIFAPNIDKIDLKRYNNIILYDYLFTLDEYNHIYKNKGEKSKIVNNYNETSLLYIQNIVDNIIPNRDDFLSVYKNVMINKEVKLDTVDIKKIFGVSPLKFFTASNVFKELKLLDYSCEKDSIFISMLPKPDSKMDLNSSLILKNLNELISKFKSSY